MKQFWLVLVSAASTKNRELSVQMLLLDFFFGSWLLNLLNFLIIQLPWLSSSYLKLRAILQLSKIIFFRRSIKNENFIASFQL